MMNILRYCYQHHHKLVVDVVAASLVMNAMDVCYASPYFPYDSDFPTDFPLRSEVADCVAYRN